MKYFSKTAIAASLLAALFSGTLPAEEAKGLDALQEKVNKIAAEKGIPAPNVRAELAGKAKAETEVIDATDRALKSVSPIERIVAIDANTIRAIKSADGRIMYLVDNGRFAFVGKMVDIWNRKELSTIEDIADAVSHINLKRMGFSTEKVHSITVGKGKEHVTIFIDPQCGWCHKLLAEINSKPEWMDKYTWDFVIVPVLGDRSQKLSKKLFCAKTKDQQVLFDAVRNGARTIDGLEQVEKCDTTVFDQTKVISQALGLRGVPMVIAPDGRFTRGKPKDLTAFLNNTEVKEAAPQTPNAAQKPQTIDLKKAGFDLKNTNSFSVGSGRDHVTVVVDPQCSWCHKLIAELNAEPQYMKDFTFDFVVYPILGDKSTELAKKLFCAKTKDGDVKFRAFTAGADGIEALKSAENCADADFAKTQKVGEVLGVESVPVMIAPDGRLTRGKPRDLHGFLYPAAKKGATAPAKK